MTTLNQALLDSIGCNYHIHEFTQKYICLYDYYNTGIDIKTIELIDATLQTSYSGLTAPRYYLFKFK